MTTNLSDSGLERSLSALPSQPLTDSDLHIWCASLNASPENLSYYLSLLSPDEVRRAERFYFERDRNRFIIGHGLLRFLLGGYLNMNPAEIVFVYGEYGKPSLKPVETNKVLEFNVAHSQDLVLYAFNWDRKVGIDVEYMIPLADMDDFARQFFSPKESQFINSLSGKQKEDAFFKTWTCKEAFMKANGTGLTIPINQVEITLSANEEVRLNSIGSDNDELARWHLELFEPISGYQAAMAVEGYDGRCFFRSYPTISLFDLSNFK